MTFMTFILVSAATAWLLFNSTHVWGGGQGVTDLVDGDETTREEFESNPSRAAEVS